MVGLVIVKVDSIMVGIGVMVCLMVVARSTGLVRIFEEKVFKGIFVGK